MLDCFSNKVLTPDFLCLAGHQLSSHIALHGCDLSGVYTLLLFHTHTSSMIYCQWGLIEEHLAFIEVVSYPSLPVFWWFNTHPDISDL